MAQTSWNFVCGLTWVVSERFHDQKGTIMCQAPGWVQDPKIQKFQEFWNSDIFFIFFVQNWLPRTQRPFPLNSWWKNGPFWCKNHCSSSKTVDFSIFSGGARKKLGPLGCPLSDMTPNQAPNTIRNSVFILLDYSISGVFSKYFVDQCQNWGTLSTVRPCALEIIWCPDFRLQLWKFCWYSRIYSFIDRRWKYLFIVNIIYTKTL